MVFTVTLNPALDCYLTPESLRHGMINRYSSIRFLPGGKGVNVSLMLNALGRETSALGIAAGFTGHALAGLLDQAGCHSAFLFLREGYTRLNLKLSLPGQRETHLNGDGPAIPGGTIDLLEQQLATVLRPGDVLVLAGSLPAGLPADLYVRLSKAAPQDITLVIDTSGPALAAGIQARPFLVKPNLEELGGLFNVRLSGMKDGLRCAKRLRRMGARNVLVSMGGQGAFLLAEDGQTFYREALPGREASPVGAGDSMVAGFLHGWLASGSLENALDWAVAAGAATAFTEGLAGAEEVFCLYNEAFGTTGG